MDPVVARKADPAVNRWGYSGRADLDARIIRIDPGRIDFLVLDGIVTGRVGVDVLPTPT